MWLVACLVGSVIGCVILSFWKKPLPASESGLWDQRGRVRLVPFWPPALGTKGDGFVCSPREGGSPFVAGAWMC